MESKFAAASALAAQGFLVFPLASNAKAPPLLNGWPAAATNAAETVAMFWTTWPNANVGIHCKGLVVIDVDVKKGGNDALDLLRLRDGLPATRVALTPSGGAHHFYRLPHDHPGVPNSVSQLGPGLDIRSTNGYVVGAGSTLASGTYRWEDDTAPIVDAPEWLVAALGVQSERPAAPVATVPDAAPEVVERAREWLKTAERSVKGSGGDQAAFRVAAGLRDLGVSYAQACDLMRGPEWDFGCGWRDGRLEDKPIRSAYRYAENEPGARAVRADDFPAVQTAKPVTTKRTIRTLAELAGDGTPTPGYVVKGLLQRASYGVMYGAPGEGKTFTALDLAYHVAAEKKWLERRVNGGCVLYLAYEGQGGLKKRAQALRQQYGTTDVPLYVVGANFNLREKQGRQDLGATMADLPTKPVLIIIDTFARALMGGDENSAQDVGAFNAAIEALIQSTGACVLVIHHSGKDASKGARGSSAILGAIDTEIEVRQGQIVATKQRDVDLGEPVGFKLTPIVVGMDEDGEDITSCIVEPAAVQAAGQQRITGNAKRGFETLCVLAPDNKPVTLHTWKEACKEFLGDRGASQRFYDLKRVLTARGYIEVVNEDLVKRKML